MLNSDAGDSKLNKPALNTNVSTPGHEFPGSYPRETEAPSNHTNGDSKNGPMGASVVHAAKQYIPDQVERGIEYTGHTAAAYLPIPQAIKDTVVSYWCKRPEGEGEVVAAATSLPSKELTGQQPLEHTSGVGALPGNASESGVALLPDERVQQSQPLMQSLPSKELAGQQPFEHTSGVGALPGTASESGVALLPDERVQQSQPIQPSVANTDSHTKPKTENGASTSHSESQYDQSKVGEALRLAAGAGAAGAAVGGLAAKSNNTTEPDPARKDRNASAPKQAAAAHTPSKSTSKSVPDKDTDYHPAKLHPPPAGTGVGESAQSDSPHASSSSPSEAQRASPTSASTTGSPKKVGFMTKVKGEAKIIAGKMSGNDSKVEQGKRVLHGQV
ncbi:hypothetical protein BJ138DRAFT_1006528 [Hygrophoropsis aurantiaca]|uniref:Uncharacterized protein n=1 Tax=Hygrophoropsis aurantiaca TaxID=72124 RepID=A0ACB8AF37_9AGAM|nr:hypothetical protein BJ138DRAFT_1006528 [Hygrophoropsis aurantiaca]